MARSSFDAAPVRSVLGRLLNVHTDERAWRKGAAGEEAVGKLLDKLPKDEWRVFHDISIGDTGTNIDHLVIGPRGIYSINTKNLSGKVWLGSKMLMVNGQKTTYLRASLSEGRKVAQRLSAAVGESVEVNPMILLLCDELTIREQPKDAVVMRRREGLKWMSQRPKVHSLALASRIARAADQLSTWE